MTAPLSKETGKVKRLANPLYDGLFGVHAVKDTPFFTWLSDENRRLCTNAVIHNLEKV